MFSSYNSWDGNRKYVQTQERIELERHRAQSIELSKGYAALMENIVDFIYLKEISGWDIDEVNLFEDKLLSVFKTHVEDYNRTETNKEDLYEYYMSLNSFNLNFSIMKRGMLALKEH